MKLKKGNAVLGLLLVLSLCGHAGTMCVSLWTGWYDFVLCKALAGITVSLAALHVICSLAVFFFAHDGADLKYKSCNTATVLQRASALVMLVLLHVHRKAYSHMATGTALTGGQTVFFCITEFLFFASVMTHIAVSVSKAVISLGLAGSARTVLAVERAAYVLCALAMIAVSGGMLFFFLGGLIK